MPKLAKRPKALQHKIFRGRDAIQRGLLTLDDLRSSAWRTLFRGVYVDGAVAVTHGVRCSAASLYVMPAGGAIAGRSAAFMHGVELIDDGSPVEVLVPVKFGPVTGLFVRRALLLPEELQRHGQMTLTSPIRTCWDLARWLDVIEAVVFIDAMLAKRCVTPAELDAYARSKTGLRGLRRFERAIAFADRAAESPQESRLRVRIVLAGLPRPVAQYVITRNGRFVARVDLAYPEYKIAIEYDGIYHANRYQLERDRARLNKLVGEDWLVLHVTARQMHNFDALAREIREALKKANPYVGVAGRSTRKMTPETPTQGLLP